MVGLVIPFLDPNANTSVQTLILSQFQVPITSNICFDSCSIPQAFHRINLSIWVKLNGIFVRVALLILFYIFWVLAYLAPLVNRCSKAHTDQAKTL